jgi:hypothetical protein
MKVKGIQELKFQVVCVCVCVCARVCGKIETVKWRRDTKELLENTEICFQDSSKEKRKWNCYMNIMLNV